MIEKIMGLERQKPSADPRTFLLTLLYLPLLSHPVFTPIRFHFELHMPLPCGVLQSMTKFLITSA